MAVWNDWPHTLQRRFPTPFLRSIFTITVFSWLQKRQVKTFASGSCCTPVVSGLLGLSTHGSKPLTFFGP